MAVRGAGAFIEDSAGKRYLTPPAARRSLVSAMTIHGWSAPSGPIGPFTLRPYRLFQQSGMEALADHLIAAAPGDLDRVYFVSGGSEAVEAALKMARQYFLKSASRNAADHHPAAKLPWQHAGRAGRRRQ